MSRQKKNKPVPDSKSLTISPRVEVGLLVGIMTIFYLHVRYFDFIQDDSFITFRYIKNFIEGNGLVWNIGERVEGYTTFLWTLLLAVPAKLGFDLVSASQLLGAIFGLATLGVLYLLSLFVSPERRFPGFSLIAVLLMAANTSAAYWTVSGMETALFTFLVVLAVWFTLKERNSPRLVALAPLVFVLLSFTRPEGMFLFGLTMLFLVGDLLLSKGKNRAIEIKRIVVWSLLYAVPVGIFMLWRLSYYGYLFPNTYYAKAGISQEYFNAGLEYFVAFAKHYLLWGGLLLLPTLVLVRRKFSRDITYLFYLIVSYTAYIITVGGDVLPAHRFFIPILPLIYLLVQEGIHELAKIIGERQSVVRYALLAGALGLGYLTYSIPYDYVRQYWSLEQGLVGGMTNVGNWLKQRATPNTVIAASTIGAVGYYSEVTLVDMLGLTDETIAHHPEKIFGVKSGWRERNYNVTYVLSRKPDFILFSTGIKPSAFAERALFTKEEFRRWYYPYYYHPSGDVNDLRVIYKRASEPLPAAATELTTKPVDNDFINQYYEGMNRARRWPDTALVYFKKSLAIAPPGFAMLHQEIGNLYRAKNNTEEALKYYRQAVAADPRMVESQLILGFYAREQKDFAAARIHLETVVKYDPDFSLGWTLLGETYAALGMAAEAQRALKEALRLAPNNDEAARQLQQFAGR